MAKSAASKYPPALIKIRIPSTKSPVFETSKILFSAIPSPPPITTAIVPPVTAKAFAETNSFLFTSNGRPAESPARIKRLAPKEIKTKRVKTIPVEPLYIR